MGNPEEVFPSSPVIFVKKEGLYHCVVSCEDSCVTASVMHVKLASARPIGNLHLS